MKLPPCLDWDTNTGAPVTEAGMETIHWLFNCLNSDYITTWQLMLWKQGVQLIF